jgi:hypothetical protein
MIPFDFRLRPGRRCVARLQALWTAAREWADSGGLPNDCSRVQGVAPL